MNFNDPFKFPDFQRPKPWKVEVPTFISGTICEEKMDGIRAMVSNTALKLKHVNSSGHQLLLRDGRQIPRGCILDGEIMAKDEQFTAVQGRLSRRQWKKLIFVPFDVLYWDGKSLRQSPLHERRSQLVKLDPGPQLVFPKDGHVVPPVEWEGIVCKRLDESYQAGMMGSWLKWKQTGVVTVRILGFEEGEGSLKGLTAKIVFGLKLKDGSDFVLGKAGIPLAIDRWEFHHRGEKYIGRKIFIRHYGIMKVHFRNPIYEGFADTDE